MANRDYYEGTPERIVIVNGPTFGQGLKYIVFGAIIGAGGAYYVLGGIKRKSLAARAKAKAAERASRAAESVLEEVEGRVEAVGESVEERLKSLAGRVRDLSDKAKNTVDAANEMMRPVMERAVAEGKKAAAQTRAKLKDDVDEAGDRPFLAELDEELPSQQPDKFVE